MSHLCSRWSNGSWFHYELNPKVYIDFRDSIWSSVLLTSSPTPLSFSSSHCFSYTNFLATLQIHQAAAHSHLRVFALAHVPRIFAPPNPAICMTHSISFRSLLKCHVYQRVLPLSIPSLHCHSLSLMLLCIYLYHLSLPVIYLLVCLFIVCLLKLDYKLPEGRDFICSE